VLTSNAFTFNLPGGGTQTLTNIKTIAFAAVPEPSSLILCGMGALGAAAVGWWKRKKASPPPAVPSA
jgi:hypothetical protein